MAKKIYNSETGEVEEQGGGKSGLPVVQPTWPLVEGFCDNYQPCGNELAADEVFTLGKLRDYFKCYAILDPRWVDVFPKYLDALVERGFKVQTAFCGEPAIFVNWKFAPHRPEEDDFDEE